MVSCTAFLALNPKSEVHAFDAGTAPEVVPGHDYLDPKYAILLLKGLYCSHEYIHFVRRAGIPID